MLPSSSRVKLNRVALKNIGLNLLPRRRRVPKSTSNVTADPKKEDEDQPATEPTSVRDTASVHSSNEPVQTVLTDRGGPENVTDTADNIPAAKLEESRVDIDRKTHPSPAGRAHSEGSLRRSVRASRCALCGDCKYICPQRTVLGKQGQSSGSPEPEKPSTKVKLEKKSTETTQKIIIWIDQYPKVTLCDIAPKCDAFSHDCGYLLPDVLKTNAVHCFKQDMSAGFRFGPRWLGHNNHESEKGAAAKNTEKSVRQSLIEHQRDLKEYTDTQTLSSHTACFLNSWTSEGSATCSASSLLGKRTKKGECRTGMWDRDVEKDPGAGYHLIGEEICRNKRIKLGDSVKDGILPSTPVFESISCKIPANTDTRDKERTCFCVSDDSQWCPDHAVVQSSSSGSDVKENCVHKKTCGGIDSPTNIDAAQMPSEMFCQRNKMDMDELESFTCQRVRVYHRKINVSCARTCMSWPFPDSGWKLRPHSGTAVRPAEAVDPSTRDSPINQNQPDLSSNRTTDPSSGTTHQVSRQNEEDGERILAARNGKGHGNMSSYSSDSKDMEFAPHLMETKDSLASLHSDTAHLPNPSQYGGEPGTDTLSASSLPVNGPKTDSSMSNPSPTTLGLSDWETATTLSPMSSPLTHGGLSSLSATPSSLLPSTFLQKAVNGVEFADAHSASTSPMQSSSTCVVKAVEKPLFYCEETQMTACHNSDSFQSCTSSLLLTQDEPESDEEHLADRSPPKLEAYYNTSPINYLTEKCVETGSVEFLLPPVLSPVSSPRGCSRTSVLPQKRKMLPGCHMPQTVNGNNDNSEEYLEHSSEELEGVSTNFKPLTSLMEPQSSPSNDEDVDDGNEEESQDETDYEEAVERVYKGSEQVPSDPKIKAALTSGVLSEPCSSSSSDEDDEGASSDEGRPRSSREDCSSPPEEAGSERVLIKVEGDSDAQQFVLDEFTAYEQDILLVDVIQDDPELFENLPQERLLKLGPTRVTETPKSRPFGVGKTLSPRKDRASLAFEQRLTPVDVSFLYDSPDITEESNSRSWRPQCASNPSKMQSRARPATVKLTKNMGQPDANNNHVNGGLERSQPIPTVTFQHNHIPPPMTKKNGPRISNPANMVEFKRQKSNLYCRQYFSESLSCGFKMCWFQHVPVEGDEKFCTETVIRFMKNPMCLQKAGAVFAGYYQTNPPGGYFSMPVFLSLVWALLKAGMVSDVFSVLSVSLAHKIVPGHEFLLALFNFVREKALIGFVPELMQLTFKMASAGLVLSLDCLDCVKNTPEFQQTVHPNLLVSGSGNHKISATSAPFSEYLNLAHGIVEIELCTKQENWRRMGEVFRSICQSSQRPNQVERISGRIAIALLSESKDKLSLPFATFAETVCQNEEADSPIRSFLGRIGVSLMLRYHKTHQWAKGRRVVEVLSISKVNYSTLKGLFGNEDGTSRCCLVTVATELFLLSGSVEGALNTLRENKWFLSSCSWPCEPTDLESRTRVLTRLAEKTSHRDTLEVLSNLPGLKEPNDLIDISMYGPLFNSHLLLCVDRQTLPVASDTVDFMLSKNLAVDHATLQMLLHKLGKQNLWLRAREVFRHSLSVGYYPGVSAPPGFMALIIPCQLREVELALTFEMFITVNATVILHLSENTTSSLSITLKRTQSCESEYLSAGSRLLSAACIPQPKLIVHYTAVNSSQEQVFTLDMSSARFWLRHNHLWANEVWTH